MAGILDFLTGQMTGSTAPQWGALYPPVQFQPSEADQAQQARDAAAATLAARFRGASHAPAPVAPDNFGAGAAPFGFAGPGSSGINGVSPASLANAPQPAPVAPVAPSPQAAMEAPATDVSSVNRPVGPPINPAPPQTLPGEAPAAPVAPVAAPSPAPFSLGGGAGIGDRLAAAAQSMQGSSGLIPGLFNGVSGLVTGQRADPAGRAEEKALKAQTATSQALIAKGASPAEVAAAAGNPTLMKALVDNYYGKDKWAIVQVGENDGVKTYKQQNQVDGTLRDIPGVAAGGAAAGGDFVTGPDGKPIAIPPGVNRKEFIKQVTHSSADAATGKQTEAQGKASSFAARMELSQKALAGLENQGLDATQAVSSRVPGVGNYLQSADHQRYETAKSAFISAKLRRESGAAISPHEYQREERELFPRPGDDPSVVVQKAQLRAAALEQMKREAGPGYRPSAAAAPSGSVNIGGQSVPWSVN